MTEISLLLKETRQKYGLTLEDVAQRTYIKLPYLEALEEGHLEALPASVYTCGYIRQYAKLLGLDGEELVARFQHAERANQPHQPGSYPSAPGAPSALNRSQSPMPHDALPPYKNGHGRSNGGNGQGNGHGSGQSYRPADAAYGQATSLHGEAPEVQQARAQAQQILQAAEREAQQMIRGAETYAAEVLGNLEVEVAKALQIIQNGRQYINTRRQPGPSGH